VALARIDPLGAPTSPSPDVASSQAASHREEVTHDGNVLS
jgi:hypothetical protein